MIEDESYWGAAKRELAEEISISEDKIQRALLIPIGNEGEFQWKGHDHIEGTYNYEFSSLYLYYVNPTLESEIKGQEILHNGEKKTLNIFKKTLLDLLTDFHANPSDYADGITRVLEKIEKKHKIRLEIENTINSYIYKENSEEA